MRRGYFQKVSRGQFRGPPHLQGSCTTKVSVPLPARKAGLSEDIPQEAPQTVPSQSVPAQSAEREGCCLATLHWEWHWEPRCPPAPEAMWGGRRQVLGNCWLWRKKGCSSSQSLVVVSRLPYINLFQSLLQLVAPEYFEKLDPCLEAGEGCLTSILCSQEWMGGPNSSTERGQDPCHTCWSLNTIPQNQDGLCFQGIWQPCSWNIRTLARTCPSLDC